MSELEDRVDDIDELLAELAKSNAVLVKAIEASTKAKIDIAIDTPGTLAKLEDFSKAFFARLHKAYGLGARSKISKRASKPTRRRFENATL